MCIYLQNFCWCNILALIWIVCLENLRNQLNLHIALFKCQVMRLSGQLHLLITNLCMPTRGHSFTPPLSLSLSLSLLCSYLALLVSLHCLGQCKQLDSLDCIPRNYNNYNLLFKIYSNKCLTWMQFMSSTSVNCIEEIQLLMPIRLLLLLLLAKKFLAISNSNVEKRAVAAGRVDGENTLLDSLANCVPRPPDGPQLHGGKCSKGNIGRGGEARMHWKWWPQPQACQDAGHGTLLGWHSRHCILFSAHANAQKYAAGWQSMKREREKGREGELQWRWQRLEIH